VRERGGEILVLLLHAAARERDQHTDLDAAGIEMLLPHKGEVRSRQRAVRRKGISSVTSRLHARMGQLTIERLANVWTECRGVLTPTDRQIRP
jgi:hypothetical protein